jgi:RNA polymerase sigma-70 factor (ECF subfamily)
LTVEEVYRMHAADVARWAARLGGSHVELEDAVQEVFTQVQRHLDSYRGEAKLTSWLFQITANVVRQHRRRDRWRRWMRRSDDPVEEIEGPGSPHESLEARQARDLVHRAMDRMSERYRTALVLFEIEDLPGEEVAERMGIKLSNLWVLLHRARAELVRRVEELREGKP